MKKAYFILVLVFASFLNACTTKTQNSKESDSHPDSYRDTENPYFGQKPPGLTAEIFAPGVISINGRYEHSISFSPDLDEIYFTASKKRRRPKYLFFKTRRQ